MERQTATAHTALAKRRAGKKSG